MRLDDRAIDGEFGCETSSGERQHQSRDSGFTSAVHDVIQTVGIEVVEREVAHLIPSGFSGS